jgi:WhiB family redox-sensing transcriptional regulator
VGPGVTTPRRGVESLVSIAASDRLDLAAVAQPPAWSEQAICSSVDLDLFFPAKGAPSAPAKKICASCPVRQECLDYADSIESGAAGLPTSYGANGVWGGLSPRERAARRRSMKAAS